MHLIGSIVAYITGVWLTTLSSLDHGLAAVGLPGPCAYGYCENIISYNPLAKANVNNPSAVEYFDPLTTSPSHAAPILDIPANAILLLSPPITESIPKTPETSLSPTNQQHIDIPDFTPFVRPMTGRIGPPLMPKTLFHHIGITPRLPSVRFHTGPKKANIDGAIGNYIILIVNYLISPAVWPTCVGVVIYIVLIQFDSNVQRRGPRPSRSSVGHGAGDNRRDESYHINSCWPARYPWSCLPSVTKSALNSIVTPFDGCSELWYPLAWALSDFIIVYSEERQSSTQLDRNDIYIVSENSTVSNREANGSITLTALITTLIICALLLCYRSRIKVSQLLPRWFQSNVQACQAQSKTPSRLDAVISGTNMHIEELEVATIDSGEITFIQAIADQKHFGSRLRPSKHCETLPSDESVKALQVQLNITQVALSAAESRNKTLDLEQKQRHFTGEKALNARDDTIKKLREGLHEANAWADHQTTLLDAAYKINKGMPMKTRRLETAHASLQKDLNLALSSKQVLTDTVRATKEKLEMSEWREKRTEIMRRDTATAYHDLISIHMHCHEQRKDAVAELGKRVVLMDSELDTLRESLEQAGSEWLHIDNHDTEITIKLRDSRATISKLRDELEKGKADREGGDKKDESGKDALKKHNEQNAKTVPSLEPAKPQIASSSAPLFPKGHNDEASQRKPGIDCHIPDAAGFQSPLLRPQLSTKGTSTVSKVPLLAPDSDVQEPKQLQSDQQNAPENCEAEPEKVESIQNSTDPATDSERITESESQKAGKCNIFDGKIFDTSSFRLPDPDENAILRPDGSIFTSHLTPSMPPAGADNIPSVTNVAEHAHMPLQNAAIAEQIGPYTRRNDASLLPLNEDMAVVNAPAAANEAFPADTSAVTVFEYDPNDPLIDFDALGKIGDGLDSFFGDEDIDMADTDLKDTNHAPRGETSAEDHAQVFNRFEDAEMGDYQPYDVDRTSLREADQEGQLSICNGPNDAEMGDCEPDNISRAVLGKTNQESQLSTLNGFEDAEMNDSELSNVDLDILGETRRGDPVQSTNIPSDAPGRTQNQAVRLTALFERKYGPGSASAYIRDIDNVAMSDASEDSDGCSSELSEMVSDKWRDLEMDIHERVDDGEGDGRGIEWENLLGCARDDNQATSQNPAQSAQDSERTIENADRCDEDDGLEDDFMNQPPEVFLPLPILTPTPPVQDVQRAEQDRMHTVTIRIPGFFTTNVEQHIDSADHQLSEDDLLLLGETNLEDPTQRCNLAAQTLASSSQLLLKPDEVATKVNPRFQGDSDLGFVGDRISTKDEVKARKIQIPRLKGARGESNTPSSAESRGTGACSGAATVPAQAPPVSRKKPVTGLREGTIAALQAEAARVEAARSKAVNGVSSTVTNAVNGALWNVVKVDGRAPPAVAQPVGSMSHPTNTDAPPQFDERWKTELPNSANLLHKNVTTPADANQGHCSPLYNPRPAFKSSNPTESRSSPLYNPQPRMPWDQWKSQPTPPPVARPESREPLGKKGNKDEETSSEEE